MAIVSYEDKRVIVPIIEIEGLNKSYNGVHILHNVNLSVPKASIFGLLGPNGAGKSTLLDIMEGLRIPDSGRILVDGTLVKPNSKDIKRLMGVQPQSGDFFDQLTARESVEFYARLYGKRVDGMEMLSILGLQKQARTKMVNLSGGQKQRLSIVMAIAHNPRIILLDEPTAGLDPQSRRLLWDFMLTLKERGSTVVITTHYMDEAEYLCDDLAIIHKGAVITAGSPGELIREYLPESVIEVNLPRKRPASIQEATSIEYTGNSMILHTDHLEVTMMDLMKWSTSANIQISGLKTRTPTLEDLFLKLTGDSLTVDD